MYAMDAISSPDPMAGPSPASDDVCSAPSELESGSATMNSVVFATHIFCHKAFPLFSFAFFLKKEKDNISTQINKKNVAEYQLKMGQKT